MSLLGPYSTQAQAMAVCSGSSSSSSSSSHSSSSSSSKSNTASSSTANKSSTSTGSNSAANKSSTSAGSQSSTSAGLGCCGGSTPNNLHFNINGQSFAFNNGGGGVWQTGLITVTGCGNMGLNMSCINGNYSFYDGNVGGGCVVVQIIDPLISCSPFTISATIQFSGSCSCSTESFTITT